MTPGVQPFNFFPAQRKTKPRIKNTTVKIVNISASANISPVPCCDLSRKEFKAPHAQRTAMTINNTPVIFKSKENVFFIKFYLSGENKKSSLKK